MAKPTMGELICRLRKEKGMTQKDLAEKLNVTDKAVSKWERDLSCPDISSLPRLAEVLGVTTDELLQADPREKPQNTKADKIIDTVLLAVPLAEGVALIVSSILGEMDLLPGLTMTGIGLVCLALYHLRKLEH